MPVVTFDRSLLFLIVLAWGGLTGLRLQQPAQPGERVWAQDKPVGAVASAALSPRFGAIALGVLRKPHFEPGSNLAVGSDAGSALPALSVTLPFTESQ